MRHTTKNSHAGLHPESAVDPQLHTFRVLLDADSAVDELKLRRAAASGVPPHHRGEVWKLLLGIASCEKSDDVAHELNRIHQYTALSTNVDNDGDIPRHIRRVLKRSRSAYQPVSMHDKKYGRQGSTSGDSVDDDDDDDLPVEAPLSNRPVLSSNGRPKSSVRASHHNSHMRVVDRDVQNTFITLITTYLQRTTASIEFDTPMVYLCAPFIELMPTEADAFYAFNALMQRYQYMYTDEGLREAVSDFNVMFRALHPTLHDKFVLEEVDMNPFVRKWLRGLLVEQLPRRALLRLWDSYFANLGKDGLGLHPYVCLVFIDHLKPELEDCDDSERITSLLNKLPALDIDHIIAHALTAREQLRERGIIQ